MLTRRNQKIMEKKATAFIPKGIPSIPPKPISDSSTHIEELARACGISLGEEESARLANISIIQAREEALLALQKTKQKVMLSSDKNLEVDNTEGESGNENRDNIPAMDDAGGDGTLEANLLHIDQG